MHILFRLTTYALCYKSRLTLAYACTIVATVLSLAIPRLLGNAIDTVIENGLQKDLLWIAVAMVGVSIIRGVLAYGQGHLGEWLSQRVAYDIRNSLYDKLQRLSFGFHDHNQTGDLMAKATVDIESIRWFIQMGLLRGTYVLVLFVTIITILATIHWQLALVSLSLLPPLIWRCVTASRLLRILWRRIQDSTGVLVTILQENLAGVRVVKAFGAETYEQTRFHQQATKVARETYASGQTQASMTSLLNFVFTLVTGAIIWRGGTLVIGGEITPGELAQFLFFMGMLLMPVRTAGFLVNTFSRAMSSGQRIFDVLDAESEVREMPMGKQLSKTRGDVLFENVSLIYSGNRSALQSVNIKARPGQVTAIMGHPGSGKSALIHLLPRFYDVTGGKVTIDGYDVRNLNLESLRRNVGVVLQDSFIFNMSIRDNIAYGAIKASEEQIQYAATVAQLHDFISGLPNGYDTWVGERGVTLSGGQRQRLSIARTLLLDPPILALDDSTSSVDPLTERLIQQALRKVMSGRTTFVIAHRLSTVMMADHLVVLENGSIAEEGTHAELLSIGGLYKQIYELQLQPQEESLQDPLD